MFIRRASLLVAASAALVMAAALVLTMGLGSSTEPSHAAVQSELPYTFFLTHYQLLGDPNSPDGVRYHSNGHPFAEAPDGSKITLSGNGGWDPDGHIAQGGGRYTIEDASGELTAQGPWRVIGFRSFERLDGWWGLGPHFEEKGWQGPPGSSSFSGFLKLKVHLKNEGHGVLTAWCLMPEVSKPDDHQGDGISLTGANFDFTDFGESEMSFEGVMFYSTDPKSGGYVLTPEGTTVPRPAPDDD